MTFIEVKNANQTAAVEALAREIWQEHYPSIIGIDQVVYMLERFQSRQAIAAQIASGVLYFLLQDRAGLAGYLAVEPRNGELFLSKIYIVNALRRKGYGREAIRFVETLASERGLNRIVLTVNRNNVTAITAYERAGFRKTGSLVQDIGGGFVMDDYRMEKKIPERL